MSYTDTAATGAELGFMTFSFPGETPLFHDVRSSDAWAKVARRASHRQARMLASLDILDGFIDDMTVLDVEFIEEYVADPSATTPVLESEFGPPTGLDLTETNIAVASVNDLIEWLGRKVEDVGDLIGVSRRQIFTWRAHPHVAPRPGSVERLYEVHAALMPLAMAVGRDRMPIELRAGVPSIIDLLDAGDMEAVTMAVAQRTLEAFSVGAEQPISAERLAATNAKARREFEAFVAGAPSDDGGDRASVTPPDE